MAIDYAAVGTELVTDWCPNAPSTIRTAAAELVADTLKADQQVRSSTFVDLREGGGGATLRDPMRASVMRRSGAAGILAPWRRPSVRVVKEDE